MSNESTITDLVQTLEDGRKGFADAAEKLADDGDATAAGRFRQFAEQRAAFSADLRGLARAEGITIDEDGSIAGALHRGWISLKDALTGDDRDAIVNAAISGEDHAVSEFEKALDDELPVGLNAKVREQLTAIQEAKATLETMSS